MVLFAFICAVILTTIMFGASVLMQKIDDKLGQKKFK